MDFKTFVVEFKRIDEREGKYLSYIKAYNFDDAVQRIVAFPKYINEFVFNITLAGELNEEIFIEEGEFEVKDNSIQNLDWLFRYLQRDLLNIKEKESLKAFLIEMEYYEFLINF